MRYQMQEGYLTLGEGDWRDRSVNMLGAGHLPAKGANLVVTREPLPDGLGIDDYIKNQKTVMARELSGLTLLAENVDSLNGLPVHFLEFRWSNQSGAMHQMVFVIHIDRCALNLTATFPGEPDETSRAEMLTAMRSFKPGPPTVIPEGATS
jgi:hypothetical protein